MFATSAYAIALAPLGALPQFRKCAPQTLQVFRRAPQYTRLATHPATRSVPAVARTHPPARLPRHGGFFRLPHSHPSTLLIVLNPFTIFCLFASIPSLPFDFSKVPGEEKSWESFA